MSMLWHFSLWRMARTRGLEKSDNVRVPNVTAAWQAHFPPRYNTVPCTQKHENAQPKAQCIGALDIRKKCRRLTKLRGA